MSAVTGWSAEMDRKFQAILRDPERYFAEARAAARRSTRPALRRRGRGVRPEAPARDPEHR